MSGEGAGVVGVKGRRVRRLRVDATWLLHHFASLDGSEILACEDDIPDDAQVVWATVDQVFNEVSLYVESASFEELIEGVAAPDWKIRLRGFWPSTGTAKVLRAEMAASGFFDGDRGSETSGASALDRPPFSPRAAAKLAGGGV